jgi:TldD protein
MTGEPLRFDAPDLVGPLESAVETARSLGAEHVEARMMRTRVRHVSTADRQLESAGLSRSSGVGIRVLVDGCWGFAGTSSRRSEDLDRAVRDAVLLARASRPLATNAVVLAPEPAHVGHWESACLEDPFEVSNAEVEALLCGRESAIASFGGVQHTDASFMAVDEATLLLTSGGTRVSQRKTRVHADITALGGNERTGVIDTMRSLAPPTARGFEYLRGDGWDWDSEIESMPALLVEKLAAPSVRPGSATVVLDPSNLWLTIHESVGHATELDRALGYEANYAGTSFATPDHLGTLRYGSALMHVTGDRTTQFGLATTGWDDEGVAAQEWDLVRDGVLVGYQLDRAMAGEFGLPRSNGCSYADSPQHTPIQRMPNVSLRPGLADISTAELIAGVEDGYYIAGDKSWSIDMQRYNFQFTGQRFYRIRAGVITGQVRDLAYQSRTPEFWGSLVALGGPSTYVLGGALNCGKAQPGQVAAVSHGCPTAVFENVVILNASDAS